MISSREIIVLDKQEQEDLIKSVEREIVGVDYRSRQYAILAARIQPVTLKAVLEFDGQELELLARASEKHGVGKLAEQLRRVKTEFHQAHEAIFAERYGVDYKILEGWRNDNGMDRVQPRDCTSSENKEACP